MDRTDGEGPDPASSSSISSSAANSTDLEQLQFRRPADLDIVGIYPNYRTAYDAWKAKAQATVDNARMRYFVVHCIGCSSPTTAAHESRRQVTPRGRG